MRQAALKELARASNEFLKTFCLAMGLAPHEFSGEGPVGVTVRRTEWESGFVHLPDQVQPDPFVFDVLVSRVPSRLFTPGDWRLQFQAGLGWKGPTARFYVLRDEVVACARVAANWVITGSPGDCNLGWRGEFSHWSVRADRCFRTRSVIDTAVANWKTLRRLVGDDRIAKLAGHSVVGLADAAMAGRDYVAGCALQDWAEENAERFASGTRLATCERPDQPLFDHNVFGRMVGENGDIQLATDDQSHVAR